MLWYFLEISAEGLIAILQRLNVFIELAVERMAGHGLGIAKDDEFHAGTGNGHVHAAQVAQEANLSFVVGTYQRDDDDVALLSLETVDGVDGDETAERLEVLFLLQLRP